MKKAFSLLLALAVLFGLNACSGKQEAEVIIGESENFSKEEIQSAVDLVLKSGFSKDAGATITKIWYDEAESKNFISGYMQTGKGSGNGVSPENVIVLLSDFKTGSKTQSLNPNDTYKDWNWILIRDSKNGKWRIDDCGY
ncbi:MAG: DUF4829 domain-containing protein [Acutalibacteraceae bacterium]